MANDSHHLEHISTDPLTRDEVRALRKQLGWTQKRLAKAMGMAQQNVSRAELETGLTGAHAKLLRILVECCAGNGNAPD